ncbi:hypothetical protein GCM10029992_15570 [Glycomyces albus]
MPSPAPARRLSLRRRDLLIGGLAGLAVVAAGAEEAKSLWDATGTDHPLPDHPATGPVHMQIVAHPDDCLYFINPRVGRAMSAGAGICTVVLTAGEADGRNARDPAAAPDWASYAAARNTGLRRAYAYLATGDAESPWERYCARLDSGQTVEVCVLAARPEIHVVFCSLWTNLGRLTGEYTRLLSLWRGARRLGRPAAGRLALDPRRHRRPRRGRRRPARTARPLPADRGQYARPRPRPGRGLATRGRAARLLRSHRPHRRRPVRLGGRPRLGPRAGHRVLARLLQPPMARQPRRGRPRLQGPGPERLLLGRRRRLRRGAGLR